MTSRRGFLGAILAAGVAPAFIGSSILMPVRAIALPSPLTPQQEAAVAYEQGVLKLGETFVRATGDLRPGDQFTIAGMKDARGLLKRFTVTAVTPGSSILAVTPAFA